jgi:predicted nucleotidyltransferase
VALSKSAKELLELIYFNEMHELCKDFEGSLQWYIFGSATRKDTCAKDVDLLLISDSQVVLREARSKMVHFLNRNPIDLTIMSEDEERELSFIKRVGAQRLL